MGILGVILVILAVPLLIGYAIGQKRNIMWRNLGLIMGLIGLLIVLAGWASGR
jgi:hypothetical protein